jgi:TM2 domain-containing membrane protein YozV
MKDKGVAYLLWLFLGWLGIHRFYTGNVFSGLIWFCTGGLFGIGWFFDLFLTSGLVDAANGRYVGRNGNNNNQQTVIVNNYRD